MIENSELVKLSMEIISCRKCSRLVRYRERVALEKRKEFSSFEYWGKPVPGFGDPRARLIVVGLAPAAHGGNRTGRVFTGDQSARFLVKHLYEFGFANQSTSEAREDGLEYRNCYVTAAVRCVPPSNNPDRREMKECLPYLDREISLLKDASVILVLGRIAFDSVIEFAKGRYKLDRKFKFRHGGVYRISSDLPVIFASYHPSPRNTNTGKMTSRMFSTVLRRVNEYLCKQPPCNV